MYGHASYSETTYSEESVEFVVVFVIGVSATGFVGSTGVDEWFLIAPVQNPNYSGVEPTRSTLWIEGSFL